MPSFSEAIDHCSTFTLQSLRVVNEKTVEQLQTSGAKSLVATLQMIQLQKVILAVGMFSIFDARLQDGLNSRNGFQAAETILNDQNARDLKQRFCDLILAINVLKHGRGRSYAELVEKAGALPFRVKLPGQAFFSEGDVSEADTLIEVDDAFVQHCGDVISQVSAAIRRSRPDFT